uniref:Uncharacterized protein n=1 Tax=Opuntia streptacantha TaxID=393608 RepID=A0A7C8Z732_OPUST
MKIGQGGGWLWRWTVAVDGGWCRQEQRPATMVAAGGRTRLKTEQNKGRQRRENRGRVAPLGAGESNGGSGDFRWLEWAAADGRSSAAEAARGRGKARQRRGGGSRAWVAEEKREGFGFYLTSFVCFPFYF